MLVSGSDAAGRELAFALRKTVGTKMVASDLERYGFNRGAEPFWAEIDPQWSKWLTPQAAYAAIDALNDDGWSSALSIGETHMLTTALHVSRFLQAVGNGGSLCPPVARRMRKNAEQSVEGPCRSHIRMLNERTARELSAAMLDVVKRGTATRIKDALSSTGWIIGGKTGTGGIAGAPMSKQNGWFAGLIFDRPEARFTMATFVKGGGPGGGNAAEISAELARLLIDEDFRN